MRVAAVAIVVLLSGCFGGGTQGGLHDCDGGTDDTFPAVPGTHEMTICIGSTQRSYRLFLPLTAIAPSPMVVLLHGGGGNAELMAEKTGMDELATQKGFVAVYPQGTPAGKAGLLRTWNAMHCCGRAYDDQSDDVAFLAGLIEAAVASGAVDADRVHVAGHSNGAMMAYRFAGERSDLLASVTAVAGSIGGRPAPGEPNVRVQAPEHLLSVMIIHALDDAHVPYGGGRGQDSVEPRRDLAVTDALNLYVQALDADRTPYFTVHSANHTSQRHPAANDTELLHHRTTGGHGWPGDRRGTAGAPVEPDASKLIADWVVNKTRA